MRVSRAPYLRIIFNPWPPAPTVGQACKICGHIPGASEKDLQDRIVALETELSLLKNASNNPTFFSKLKTFLLEQVQ